MLKTTIAGLLARKLRVFTTSIAVLLGVAFMAGSLVLTDTIGKTFETMFADIYEGTDAYVRGAAALEDEPGDDARGRLDAATLEAVRAVPGVAVAEPSIQGYAQVVGKDGKAVGNPNQGAPTFGGNWSSTDELNPFHIVEGREPQAEDEVVLDKLTFDKAGLAVGETTTVLVKTGAETVRIVGVTKFGQLDSPGGASFVGFTQGTAERVITSPGTYNGISIVAAEGSSQTEVRDRIAAALTGPVEVITGDQLTEENQSEIKEGLSFFTTFIVTFAAIALFVGSFIIYNTFSILVAQRSRETALLRAVGASRRQVLGSILLEALVVGVVASSFGVVSGVGMAALLKALLAGFGLELPAGAVVLSPRTVLVSFVAGVGVSVVSAVLPARRASKVAPIEAMRSVAIEPAGSSRVRVAAGTLLTTIGTALIAVALFGDGGAALVGLGAAAAFTGVAVLGPVLARPVVRVLGSPLPQLKGMPGTLARNNAVRNPRRTSATAAALMIGVGLVGFITVFASSAKGSIDEVLDENFGADLVIDAGAGGLGGLPPELRSRLADLPEVASTAAIRVGPAVIGGERGFITAVSPDVETMFDLGVSQGDFSALGATGIAISEGRAESEGWKLGDEVVVRFAQTGDRRFQIVALYTNRQLGGNGTLGIEAWEANVADQFDNQVFILGADGVPAPALRQAVEGVAAAYPTAKVQNLDEFKNAQSAQINQMLGLIYALLALAILIAVLGIATTLALSIFERTRELGLLRAVGMTRPQLRSSVRWESVLIALFGTGTGLLVGTVFAVALLLAIADDGLGAVHVPVAQMAVMSLLAALCGVAAAVFPARRAARLDVLGAISAA